GESDASGTTDESTGVATAAPKRTRRWARTLVSPVRRIPWRRASTWLAILSILLLASTVLAGLGWFRSHSAATHADQLRSSALHAAREYAVELTTYDYQSLDKQQEALNSVSTENFQESFAESKESLDPIFTQLKASAEGKVADAAVRDVSDSGAVVLLFVNQV